MLTGQTLAQGFTDQPYRFSTKRYYGDLGLNYYGYRFYSAGLGRWMTRDPLGEEGGLNLYTAMGNNAVNRVDLYGLIGFEEWVKIAKAAGRVKKACDIYSDCKQVYDNCNPDEDVIEWVCGRCCNNLRNPYDVKSINKECVDLCIPWATAIAINNQKRQPCLKCHRRK